MYYFYSFLSGTYFLTLWQLSFERSTQQPPDMDFPCLLCSYARGELTQMMLEEIGADHMVSDSIGIGCYIPLRDRIYIYILIIFYQIYIISKCLQYDHFAGWTGGTEELHLILHI